MTQKTIDIHAHIISEETVRLMLPGAKAE